MQEQALDLQSDEDNELMKVRLLYNSDIPY